jgi:pyruvate dehydrogenase E2 component (dihydrolipoamide acetyltransferase)
MARAFKLPDLGEGIHEGEILAVLVTVGDEIHEGDPILEVETDKAAVEVPSPFTGVVAEIKAKPGDIVNVGDVLMTFDGGVEAEPRTAEKVPPEQPAEEEPQTTVPPSAEGVEAEQATEEEPQKTAPSPTKDVEATPISAPKEGPVPASPATRRLARELGVDLHQVSPSGPAGLVTADDVRAFTGRAEEIPTGPAVGGEKVSEVRPVTIAAPPLPDFAKWGPVERIPMRSIRRATAKQMTLAWSQIPHVHNQDMVDVTKLEEFRRKHKAEIESKGGRLTMTVFALKAVATALKAYPRFNATLDNEAGEIIIKNYYHIGVAVNTEDGLIVPVIRDVDRKSITELAIELYSLVQKTRERKTTLEEMQGGTFTITNVGPMGGGYFAPIINYPQVSILGMGTARMEPVVRETEEKGPEIVPRLMMPIVLCIDHRVLDGADALQFIRVVIDDLEDPDQLLMTMV